VHIEYETHGYAHIKVSVALNGLIELQGYELNKTLKDPLEIF